MRIFLKIIFLKKPIYALLPERYGIKFSKAIHSFKKYSLLNERDY